MRLLVLSCLPVILLGVLSGCGDDDDEDASAIQTADEAVEPTPDTTDDAADRADLIGQWQDTEPNVWTFNEDGTWLLAGPTIVNEGTYTATASEITLVITDSADCGGPGVYAWTIEEDVLTFVLVDDDCAARRDFLSSSPSWTLRESSP